MKLKKVAHRGWSLYKRRHRRIDFIVPLLVGAALIIWWDCTGLDAAKKSMALFATFTGVAGTLLGFAITTMALLLALFPQAEFNLLRRHADYVGVFADPKFAIATLGATTLFSLGATVAAAAGVHSPFILAIVLALAAWCAVTLAHAVRILWLAVRVHVNAEQDF